MVLKKGIFLLVLMFCFSIFLPFGTKVQAQNAVSGERIAGVDRYKTSIEISKFGWQGTSDTVIIATGEDFPDALSAAPLASKYKAPILLTYGNTLKPEFLTELSRLKVTNVFIIGGTGVVPKSIEDQLTLKGIKCTRLSGNDRYETSAAVAKMLDPTGKAAITTGLNFPDALSIAPWAASNGVPILLTEPDELPKFISDYLKEKGISSTYVIGGTGAVNNQVMSKLPKPQRIEGKDRYATNLAILKMFGSEFDLSRVFLATGSNFPDALSGSALAAVTKSPIVLTDADPLPDTRAYMDSKNNLMKEAYFIGGEGVLSEPAIVNVMPPLVSKIEVTIPANIIGMNKQLKVMTNITMIPADAPKPDFGYIVSNSSLLKIDTDGTITGLVPGNTKVTVVAGGKYSSVDVKVILDKQIVLDPGHGGSSTGAIPTAIDGTKLVQYKESLLNMQVVEKIKNKLIAIGASVVLTRDGDTTVSLEDRANIAKNLKADLFLSIHHDSVTNPSSTGTSAFYSTYKPSVDTQDVYTLAYGASPVYGVNGSKLGNLEEGKEYKYVKEENDEIYIIFNGSIGKTTVNYVRVYDKTPSIVSQKSSVLSSLINQGIVSLGLPTHGVIDNNLAVNRLTNCVSVLVEMGFISNPYEFEKIRQDSFQERAADKIVQAIMDFYKDDKPASGGNGSIPATP